MKDIERKIIDLLSGGMSGESIAKTLGVTRGVVMGKIHRLREKGLIPRRMENEKIVKLNPPDTTNHFETIKKTSEILPVVDLFTERFMPQQISTGPVSFMDLEPQHCRYVLSVSTSDEPTMFCGEPKAIKGSYCQHHHKLCYYILETRKV